MLMLTKTKDKKNDSNSLKKYNLSYFKSCNCLFLIKN